MKDELVIHHNQVLGARATYNDCRPDQKQKKSCFWAYCMMVLEIQTTLLFVDRSIQGRVIVCLFLVWCWMHGLMESSSTCLIRKCKNQM